MKYKSNIAITETELDKELKKIQNELIKAAESLSVQEAFDISLLQKQKIEFRHHITKLEKKVSKHHAVKIGDYHPLKHTFGDGYLVREINVPAGEMVITKIHKQNHPFFLLEGKCSVLTENEVKHIEAPYYAITSVGTKRIVYCHTDVVWVCVHITGSTDLEKVENEIIAKDFNDPAITAADIKILQKIKEKQMLNNKTI